jgi:pyruvate, water dikinase
MVQQIFTQESLQTKKEKALLLWLDRVNLQDIALVGETNALIGEMSSHLSDTEVKSPNGFAITTNAYKYFIIQTSLKSKLEAIFDDLGRAYLPELNKYAEQVRLLIQQSNFPQELEELIASAYSDLTVCRNIDNGGSVVVFSSIGIKEISNPHLVSWEEDFFSVCGYKELINACCKYWAALFSDRSIAAHIHKEIDLFDLNFSIGVQKIPDNSIAASGEIFSIDPHTDFHNAILISANQGFETKHQGSKSDEFFVFKPTLKNGFKPILSKRLGVKLHSVASSENPQYAITDEEILTLAKAACFVEDKYSSLSHINTPVGMKWAKDRETGEFFIFQICPIIQRQKHENFLYKYQLLETSNILLHGHAIGSKIGQGIVRVISDIHQLSEFRPGEILVTNKTDPDWRSIMSTASGIITNEGGRTCHSAISAREMGIPALVGCKDATKILKTGQKITLSCAEEEEIHEGKIYHEGKVYEGLLPFESQVIPTNLPQTRTKILINVGNPAEAFRLSALPCDGVGVTRSEFIITDLIKVHPLALIHFDEIENPIVKQEISDLTSLYENKSDYFVDKLAQGIGTISAAFYPKPVVVRMSDFKSNEYANLLGGRQFEPHEENPMLGWRGASRYYNGEYRQAYHLECKALKRVRDEMGLTNVIPLIPFCRTIKEGEKVLAEMEGEGLRRGENGLEVYVMCEVPSNVILAEKFSALFDGFSIGSNDLTQLVLGIDRDSASVDWIADERDEAVLEMIKMVVTTAKRCNRKIGICGQAPSDFPDLVSFLVDLEIDSISLNPDSLLKTRMDVFEAEQRSC